MATQIHALKEVEIKKIPPKKDNFFQKGCWKTYHFTLFPLFIKGKTIKKLHKSIALFVDGKSNDKDLLAAQKLLQSRKVTYSNNPKLIKLASRLERYVKASLSDENTTYSFKNSKKEFSKWTKRGSSENVFIQNPRLIDIFNANYLYGRVELFDHTIDNNKVLFEGKKVPISTFLEKIELKHEEKGRAGIDKEGHFVTKKVVKTVTEKDGTKSTLPVEMGYTYTFDKGFTYTQISPPIWTPLIITSVDKVKDKFEIDMSQNNYAYQLVTSARSENPEHTPDYFNEYGHLWPRLFKKDREGNIQVYSAGFYVGNDHSMKQPFKGNSGDLKKDDKYEFISRKTFAHNCSNFAIGRKGFKAAHKLGQSYMNVGLHYSPFGQNCVHLADSLTGAIEKADNVTFPKYDDKATFKWELPKFMQRNWKSISKYLFFVFVPVRITFNFLFKLLFAPAGLFRGYKIKIGDNKSYTIKQNKGFWGFNLFKQRLPKFARLAQVRGDMGGNSLTPSTLKKAIDKSSELELKPKKV